MFNIPHWKYNVDPKSYDRDIILKEIEHNYNIDNHRNEWDGNNPLQSDLHHSNKDPDNPKFKKINYKSIIPVYHKLFDNFCKTLKLKSSFTYTFQITNYTAMKSGQYMRPHNHVGDSDFTCIHYIKYNKDKHQSTLFHNANHWADDYQYLRPIFYSKLDPLNEEHSYLNKYWKLPTEENDFIITPSALVHEVPPFKSDELRVTLVINLQIK